MYKTENGYSSYFWMLLFSAVVLIFLNFTLTANLLQQLAPNVVSIDSYLYTSYAHNYSDLIERYGRTYYSARLAYIYPARLLIWLFGSDAGYLVFRNILLLGAIVAIWRICISFYSSKKIAAFVALFVVFHPWFLRSLYWDYIDGAAIVYTLLSVSFFILQRGVDRSSYFLSGVFLLLAVNCNLFTAGIFAAFLPFWYLINRKFSPIHLFIKNAPFFFLGLSLMYLFFMGISYWEFPAMSPFFDSSTYNVGKWLLIGGGNNWMTSVNSYLSQGGYFILYPLFVLFLSILFRASPGKNQFQHSSLGNSAILSLFLTICLYLIVQFVFRVNVICLFYYFCYAIPSTLLALIWLTGESISLFDSKNKTKILAVSLVAYACIWILAPYWVKYFSGISGMTIAVVTLSFLSLFLVSCVFNYYKLKACFIVLATVLSPLIFYKHTIYSALHDSHSGKKEWDIYHGAINLQDLISGALTPQSGKVGFWYSNTGEQLYLNSIQSMYLWGYSRLAALETGTIGMPVIDDTFRKLIVDYKYIALLAITKAEIEDACKSLSAEGIQTAEVLRSEYSSGEIKYQLLVLERKTL